jgi:hypothetical protein
MIEPWQAKKIRAAIQPHLYYLNRLRDRMDKAALHHEALYKSVCAAHQALRDLYVELHYLACEGGVGRKPDS